MTDSSALQRIVALEREFSALKAENAELRNRAEQVGAAIAQAQAELASEQRLNETVLGQVHAHQEEEVRNEELDFELQKVLGERDFHRRHHLEAKRTESGRLGTEFSLASLRRELQFKREESDSLKQWIGELNAQIDELSAFVKRPAADQKSDAEAEAVYSQRVVGLEESLRRAKEQNAALASTLEKAVRTAPGFQFNGAKVDQARIIISENEALRQKVESVRKENVLVRSQAERLRQSGPPKPRLSSRERATLDSCAAELEGLRRENERLRAENGPVLKEFSDPSGPDLAAKVKAALQEKGDLEERAQRLMEHIEYKEREIESLRTEGGGDGEAVRKMVEANKKMALEINRLQDQIRKLESFSRDSLLNSINN